MRQGSYAAEKLSNHVVFHGESAGDVHLCVAPQNFYENCEKLFFLTEQIRKKSCGGLENEMSGIV